MPPLRKMFSGFSGSLLSLDEADHVRDVKLEARPHILSDGVDYFTTDGEPIRPQLCAHTLNKVFSGSALDLNASADEGLESDSVLPQSSNRGTDSGAPHDPTVSTILANLSQGTEQSRQRASKGKTTVLIVGAGGYVASHAVESFLEAGYTVRATVDDISDEDLVKTLYSVHPEAQQRLIVKEVNIFQAAAFRDIMRGVHIVVHSGVSATSSKNKVGNPVKAHTEAVQALFDAVRSYGRQSVKRVVVLGAATALTMAAQGPLDESAWAQVSSMKSEAIPQARLTFVNEATRLARMVGVELTVLLPSIMIGPPLTRESSEGMRTLEELSMNSKYIPFASTLCWNYVDVRDVASALIKVAETESAKGERYIVSGYNLSMSEVGRYIRGAYPHLTAPTHDSPFFVTLALCICTGAANRVSVRYLWNMLGQRRVLVNNKGVEELDLQYLPIEQTIKDSLSEFIARGTLPPADAATAAGATPKGSSALKWLAITGVAAAVVGGAGYLLSSRK